MKLNWGAAVAGVYTAFALATSAFVAFAMGRPVDLVQTDYYAQSLRQDERMEALDNAERLGAAAGIVVVDRVIDVALPPGHVATARGTITLYRPSNASADRKADVSLDAAGRQRVSLSDAVPGLWIVQVAWTAQGRSYYFERQITVP